MTTITIKDGKGLSRNNFENLEDFQLELILMQEKFELTAEHIKILKSREEVANKNPNGLSWEEVTTGLKRKSV
ncbi:MAG: hypothetical protein CO023_01670 [Flavobacteriales bacterium CG_4_9_14_0_2_um_filter_35_242]|nr:hypothetical protein [Zetaproteobacteria bacterium]OIO11254.1 MAG: hypothetical protein AUJ53_05215 [Flavobacteriaceae bacterium CG1_02_35_72]PIV16324.1 MAG: hypothetical protein COS42_10465 [Flavobacteriales bacterium CG03_land_8_20_14_0_80_35_15]PIX05745.1 MAG: hypothetical protein COZ76_12550 [Flavobacteriales bacterium CG_4_8_14_3_um_filter_35_10]PJA05103.1 MAG: hypothetical protein COX71_08385 [Flavobacteriales bacterium CG_4_10_14_0_2_um_filter_35_18]PJC60169.1 MAG: hypothetical prote